MMAETIWDKEIAVPQKVIEYVDKNVLSSRLSSIILLKRTCILDDS